MAKFIIIGDPHLDKGLSLGKTGDGFAINSRLQDHFNLLEWALDKADENLCSHIIITGDVYEDTKPSWITVNLFHNWLEKCSVLGINVIICVGNHEIARSGQYTISPLELISYPHVKVCNDITNIFIDNTGITILPFRDIQSFGTNSATEAYNKYLNKLKYWRNEIPNSYSKCLIGHQAIKGSIWIGDEVDDHAKELFIDDKFIEGYNHVIMGHVHKFQSFKSNFATNLLHIGSLDISDFGEMNQEKYIALYDNNNISFLKLPTRKLVHFNLEVENSLQPTTDLINQIDNLKLDFNQAIVRCEINNKTKLSIDKKELEKKIISLGAFYVFKIIEHKVPVTIVNNKTNIISLSLNPSSAIKQWAESVLDKQESQEFIKFCNEIIDEYNT